MKAIVDAHGGRVEAQSEGKGYGSTFVGYALLSALSDNIRLFVFVRAAFAGCPGAGCPGYDLKQLVAVSALISAKG